MHSHPSQRKLPSDPPEAVSTPVLSTEPPSKPDFLALLQDKVHDGKLMPNDAIDLVVGVNPTRFRAEGRIVGMHTQLAHTRFADNGTLDVVGRGIPPQRHSWRLADRRRESVRRGGRGWVAANRDANNDDGTVSDNDSDDKDDDNNPAAIILVELFKPSMPVWYRRLPPTLLRSSVPP